ncbi:MAG: hypothetical protein ACO2O4_04180 [Minisyncoccia bacterium]|jgi:hypothetical protein
MYDLLDNNDEVRNIYKIRNINDFIKKLFGIFSNIEEIQKEGKSFVLLALDEKTEIIKMACWFDEDKEVVIFKAGLWKLPYQGFDIEYYYNLMTEIIILTFIKFEYCKISHIGEDQDYYYFEGEVKPIITENLGIFH